MTYIIILFLIVIFIQIKIWRKEMGNTEKIMAINDTVTAIKTDTATIAAKIQTLTDQIAGDAIPDDLVTSLTDAAAGLHAIANS